MKYNKEILNRLNKEVQTVLEFLETEDNNSSDKDDTS